MRTRRRNNRGFTLIELIVAMAVASILFTAALTLLAPLYRENRRIQDNASAQQLAGSLLDEMRALAEGSGRVYALTNAGSGELYVGQNIYTVSEGRLLLNGTPVFSADYYGDHMLEMQCGTVAPNLVEATLTVHAGERSVCTVTGLVGSLRRVLDAGNGLVFSNPPPDADLTQALLALVGWNGGAIDSTAISPNNIFAAQIFQYFQNNGVDLSALNIRAWAIRPESGNGNVMFWTDQDISTYSAGEWVRVIRYNPRAATYTPGWMRLMTNQPAIGNSYITLSGGTGRANWSESQTPADYTKQNYLSVVTHFNNMSVLKP